MQRHGLTIGVERVGETVYMRMSVEGKLTHDDYQVITPLLDNAVAGLNQVKINVLVDARKFKGWEMHAAWDDFKLGMKHRKEFSKIAIVGKGDFEKLLAKLSGWFIDGESQIFEDYD